MKYSNGAPPIAAAYLIAYADPALATITFTQEPPADLNISTGFGFIFRVAVTTSQQPIHYQWQRNGVDIPGANAATYSVNVFVASDNGARFRCRVAIPGAVVFSRETTVSLF